MFLVVVVVVVGVVVGGGAVVVVVGTVVIVVVVMTLVVLFYGPGRLFRLARSVSGAENVNKLKTTFDPTREFFISFKVAAILTYNSQDAKINLKVKL